MGWDYIVRWDCVEDIAVFMVYYWEDIVQHHIGYRLQIRHMLASCFYSLLLPMHEEDNDFYLYLSVSWIGSFVLFQMRHADLTW